MAQETSIFDLIGPVMIGPSSSHTAGAQRIGMFARTALQEEPTEVEVHLHGSFAKTGLGHGSHFAILAGIIGIPLGDMRTKESYKLAKEKGITFRILNRDLGTEHHPNTAHVMLKGAQREVDLVGSSTGGGRINIVRMNGFSTDLTGDFPALVIFHHDEPGVIATVTSCLAAHKINVATLHCDREEKGGHAFMSIEVDQAPKAFMDEISGVGAIKNVSFIDRIER